MSTTKGLVWAVVLIKELNQAKQRLGSALEADQRIELATRNARLALQAGRAADRLLAVCGGPQAAEVAEAAGVDELLLESKAEGQNQAARRGIERVIGMGGSAVLLLSSDLPLVTPMAITKMLEAAAQLGSPAVMAASAMGRGGTNALYLNPPTVIDLHFGDDSLAKFQLAAEQSGIKFAVHQALELALDLDQPSDLEFLYSLKR